MQGTVVFHFIADVCGQQLLCGCHYCLVGCTTTKPQFCTYVVTHVFITLAVLYTQLK